MMRRSSSGRRRLAQYEDEEDERVVYYDLEDDSHNYNLLLSSDAVSASAQPRTASTTANSTTECGNQIFPRQQQPLFNLDDSGDEAEGEEENPFATLLQQQRQKAVKPTTEVEEAINRGDAGSSSDNSFLSVPGSSKEPGRRAAGRGGTTSSNSHGGNHRSILKNSQQHSTTAFRVGAGGKKKLGFETAGSRPERWSTRKPSPTDTKNRRKSLGAIQKRRSQLEASAAKRRKSMPASLLGSQVTQNRSSIDDSNTSPAVPKRRLLSDVLQRATTLSQQQNSVNEESSFSPAHVDENPTEADSILDTEHQMRAEPFAPQFFSPVKPSTSGAAIGRKSKDDSIVSKIRGKLGDVIRRAVRKRNRDLTLLRSHGQHLLPQQRSHSSPIGTIGAVESIQDRASIVVCLKRRCEVTPHSVTYECQVREVAAKLKKSAASVLKEKHTTALKALFQPQTAEYLKLSSGKLLKIYEPLHFVSEQVAAGSTSKPKWLLLSTQLTEVLEDSHL